MRRGYVVLYLKVPYYYDEDTMRKYEYKGLQLELGNLKELCCPGFDVVPDEEGQTLAQCNCTQCEESINTEVDFITEASISKDLPIIHHDSPSITGDKFITNEINKIV